MCNPAIAVAALSAAATAYSVNEQRTQANYAEAAARQNASTANDANLENFKLQNSQINLQELQEGDQAAQLKQQQKLDAQKQVATARVSAGESGVSGLSIDSIFGDIVRQASNNITTIDNNLEDANTQRDSERKVLQNNTQAGMQTPSFYKGGNALLGAGLQIGTAAIGGYSAGGGKFTTKKANV
jgi:hypothetical protein